MYKLKINDDSWLEAGNLERGIFSPLKGFLNQANYLSVVQKMRLENGMVWTLPVTLEVPEEEVDQVKNHKEVVLINESGEEVGSLLVEDLYRVNYDNDIKAVFGTTDLSHPGVKKEIERSPFRVGGQVKIHKFFPVPFPDYDYDPEEMRKMKTEKGWNTMVGFQTRNPPHRAHEYLQRIGMEVSDGLLLQPIVGWKKQGDFTPKAVVSAYRIMAEQFYPKERVVLATLTVAMRYAGPREAVFHALIRKNFGCTHFIVGRDHAGVGGFYGKYEAQELCSKFDDLGITILKLCGPYHCEVCGGIVTEKTCQHSETSNEVSGTKMRELLKSGQRPPEVSMRVEISDCLIKLAATQELFH